jgi:Protein of unknown function (DUF3054)
VAVPGRARGRLAGGPGLAAPGGAFPGRAGAWLGTVAVDMVLRVVSGQGTAVAFVLVALAFLGLFLLGWRLVTRLVARRARLRADRDLRDPITPCGNRTGNPGLAQ